MRLLRYATPLLLMLIAACSREDDTAGDVVLANADNGAVVSAPLTYSDDPEERRRQDRLMVDAMLTDPAVDPEAAADEANRRGIPMTVERVREMRRRAGGDAGRRPAAD